MTLKVRKAAIAEVAGFFKKSRPLFDRDKAQSILQKTDKLMAGFQVQPLNDERFQVALTAEKVDSLIKFARAAMAMPNQRWKSLQRI